MSTFTPGPWRYIRKNSLPFGNKGFLVCNSDPKDPVPGIALITDHHKDDRPREADARLIAAAPDLLAAAKAVLNGGFEREDTEYADALFACLDQAITKATGEPS